MAQTKVKRKRISYSIRQKKEVVTYAKEHGRNQAAKYFEVDRSMVGRWVTASTSWTTETNKKINGLVLSKKLFIQKLKRNFMSEL